MSGIADDALIQIADLNVDAASCISDRSEIAKMAVAADPDRREIRDGRRGFVEPVVEIGDRAAHEIVHRAGHLKLAIVIKNRLALASSRAFATHPNLRSEPYNADLRVAFDLSGCCGDGPSREDRSTVFGGGSGTLRRPDGAIECVEAIGAPLRHRSRATFVLFPISPAFERPLCLQGLGV